MTRAIDFDTIIETFRKAENWLYTLITDPKGERYFQEKSMEVRMQEFVEQILRMQDFMDYCGNPEKMFPSVHVAGTSGKGSVVNLISGILSEAGLRVGYHVSPYLQVCTEKLMVGNRRIAPSDFTALVSDFREKYQGWKKSSDTYNALKYGESWVAITFLWMAKEKVDWAVIETGLGGRYDPTNVLPAKLAVITNVNYDHMEILGEELVSIAAHKAGIIKPEGVAITAETTLSVLEVLEQEAERKNARLYRIGKDFDYVVGAQNGENFLSVKGVYDNYLDLRVGMPGYFQYENAALAVAVVDVMRHEMGVEMSVSEVAQGLYRVRYPGRFELVNEKPVIILDGAHNQHKAEALKKSLEIEFPGKRCIIVLGTLSVKDFSGIVETLSPVAKRWIATQPRVFGKPSAPPDVLADVIHKVTPSLEILQAENVLDAITKAVETAGEDDVIVITGSLYMIGEARGKWFSPKEILLADEKLDRAMHY
jgi:dihydrofolate synthase/folylpolyglutamate synthase